MPDPENPRFSPALARVGQLASALGLFLCGYLAVQTTDWKRVVLYSLLALGSGVAASIFARMAR